MSGSIIIDQQCTLIEEQGASVTGGQLKQCFDTIVNEFDKNKSINNVTAIKHIIASLLSVYTLTLCEPGIVDQQLMVIARDCYCTILRRWRSDQLLDQCSREVFSEVSTMFANMCVFVTDTNVNLFKHLLLYKPLIDELSECLTKIATEEKYLEDSQVEAVDFILKAFNRLEIGRIEIQNDPLLQPLLNAVVKCICSISFIEMLNQMTEFEKLNQAQTLLLDTCLNYIYWRAPTWHQTHLSVAICSALLPTFTQWLTIHGSTFRQWSSLVLRTMERLCCVLTLTAEMDDPILGLQFYDGFCKMIDSFISILSSVSKIDPIDISHIELIDTLVLYLYLLTLDQELLIYTKSQPLSSMLLRLTDIDSEELQFNAYRLLASIMREQDIKTLTNPRKIAGVFFEFLGNVIDDPGKKLRLNNLLRSLKSLVQHDQIKEELTKLGALSLLLRCATETKFDALKTQQSALEILLALTFNDETARQLKQNSQFISHLKILLISSSEQGLKRAAEGLIWKLENEETAISKLDTILTTTGSASYAYDIMMSYSHNDKDLCYRLHDRLVKDGFRVWLDRDQMHGATMVAMAHAIENSELVLICMSDAYKQSAYCQSEAHYAYERRCHLIPIIMKANYRPDGWLGIMVSGKMYVDFPKLEFDLAYLKLKNEIDQHRKSHTHMIIIKPTEKLQHNSPTTTTTIAKLSETSSKPDEQQQRSVIDFPHCIDQWTKEHVKSFLINENLESLLPAFANMNGRVLHKMYTLCEKNQDSMFQTLKSEVAADGQQKPLTIGTYLRFLDAIKIYIPIVSRDNSQNSTAASVICALM